ncbi:MAG: FAD-dependent oxidoreductase [Clostridiales bacterium]|jgi:thioredoxin reductase (NADPH)|nr:FAD-dependent oxidoreductase [Clostridiales bacterium]
MYDIIIIGAGTAGMTAALYAGRAGKSVLVIEKESVGGQIIYSPRVENYPGIRSISGADYAVGLYEQACALGAEFLFDEVVSLKDNGEDKTVTAGQKEYKSKSVIIASGVRHRHLGIEFLGEGVSYCAVCDGAFYKGKAVAVAGGGNTALSDALFLSNICKKVYLIHRRDTFRGEKKSVEILSKKENVEFVLESNITALNGADTLSGVTVKNNKTGIETALAVNCLFVAVGQEPSNAVFASVTALDESGFIIASENCKTSASGIFAAGDCRTKDVRQLTTAAADGAISAIAACNYSE